MLVSLKIKNIALIDECVISLGEGLNILSGETGAGKSIIFDSLNFVLGCRADKSLIRHGTEYATVEAIFEYVSKDALEVMQELGLLDDDTLVIKRTMTESRNEVKVNGETFTLSMLRRLTSKLIDILGQHEHQSILKPAYHIELVDKFAGKRVENYKNNTNALYTRYCKICKNMQKFGNSRERANKLDILKYQIEEITAANLCEEEEKSLLEKREKYANSEKILSAVTSAYNSLEGEASISAMISSAEGFLINATSYDNEIELLSNRLDSVKIELDDIANSLKDYAENNEYDEKEANCIENRVDMIRLLKRKYGSTIQSIFEKLESMSIEYDELINADEQLAKLEKERNELATALYDEASKLSDARRLAAKTFEYKLIKELQDLAIKDVDFAIQFNDLPNIDELDNYITSNGFDTLEFLISPNLGEPLKPLAKIASGGEMSRIMLALENIISGLDGIETLVFDEIDTGISGVVAHTVAKKLNKISRSKQVIAITHLPQLASYADRHYLITKIVKGEKTITSVILLSGNERVEEIVRLSGGEGSKINILHARELLDNAKLEK